MHCMLCVVGLCVVFFLGGGGGGSHVCVRCRFGPARAVTKHAQQISRSARSLTLALGVFVATGFTAHFRLTDDFQGMVFAEWAGLSGCWLWSLGCVSLVAREPSATA
jgi:hypothetical protein